MEEPPPPGAFERGKKSASTEATDVKKRPAAALADEESDGDDLKKRPAATFKRCKSRKHAAASECDPHDLGLPAECLPQGKVGKFSYTIKGPPDNPTCVVQVLMRTRAFYIAKAKRAIPPGQPQTITWAHFENIDEAWQTCKIVAGWDDVR